MKITDNLETPVHDPVVKRGDILKVIRQYETYYYLVGKHSYYHTHDVLTNLETGNLWKAEGTPTRSKLSHYLVKSNILFSFPSAQNRLNLLNCSTFYFSNCITFHPKQFCSLCLTESLNP